MSKQKKPQKAKNTEYMRAMQELRRSSAAQPHSNKAKYKRAKAGARGRDW